jgi:hypothetical protein
LTQEEKHTLEEGKLIEALAKKTKREYNIQ